VTIVYLKTFCNMMQIFNNVMQELDNAPQPGQARHVITAENTAEADV